MFKINIYLKFTIIAVSFVLAIGLNFLYGFWYAFPFYLSGIIFLVSYILLGTIVSAGELLQTQQFVEADKRLNLTWKPSWLYKTNRAFYYLLKGTIALQAKDPKAEHFLNEAKKIELPTDNEKAMIELQLANIYAQKNNWNVVKKHVQSAKKLNVTENQIKEQLLQFEKAINQRGLANRTRIMNKGRMPTHMGGKKRRPKMR